MTIKIEIRNKLIGDSVYWQGTPEDIAGIEDIVAKTLVKQTIMDCKSRNFGMWFVSVVK